jgi:hypothetical protein
MSVDMNVYLNPVAHTRDLVTVLGILFGCEKHKVNHGIEIVGATIKHCGDQNGEYCSPGILLGFYSIQLNNGMNYKYFNLHSDVNSKGQKMITCTATPFALTVGKKLVDLFGGVLVPYDTNPNLNVYEVKKGVFKPFYVNDEDIGYIEKNIFFEKLNHIKKEELMEVIKNENFDLNLDFVKKDIEMVERLMVNNKYMVLEKMVNKEDKRIKTKKSRNKV